jgi:hypothetical protein
MRSARRIGVSGSAPGSETRVDERVRQTFGRLPLLVAFTLDQDLVFTSVDLVPCAGGHWSKEAYAEVELELRALLDDLDDEQTAGLMKGWTFARALH